LSGKPLPLLGLWVCKLLAFYVDIETKTTGDYLSEAMDQRLGAFMASQKNQRHFRG
jgi:hypothetical protein